MHIPPYLIFPAAVAVIQKESMRHAQLIRHDTGDDAVLLLHGLASGPLEMRTLANSLRRSGFSVEIPRIHGFGFGAGASDFGDWHEQVLIAFDRLKRDHRTVSVGGLCAGALLALSLAAQRPREIAGLSLLSSTLFFDGWSMPWYRFLMPLWFHTPVRHLYEFNEKQPYGIKNPEIRKRVARAMRRGYSEAGAARISMDHVYQASRLSHHVMCNLHLVTAPALVIHAIDDETASPKNAEFIMQHIGSPTKRKVLLDNSYHMITLDNERDTVAEETGKFFRANIGGLAAGLPGRASADRFAESSRRRA